MFDSGKIESEQRFCRCYIQCSFEIEIFSMLRKSRVNLYFMVESYIKLIFREALRVRLQRLDRIRKLQYRRILRSRDRNINNLRRVEKNVR